MKDKNQVIQDQITELQNALQKVLECVEGSDITPLKKRFDFLMDSFVTYRKFRVSK